MSEQVSDGVGTEVVAEEPMSVMEHAREFGKEAMREDAAPEGETDEEKTQREHHSAQQRREKESGKFADGKKRHRAASQQASPEDVPRIQALTGRAKAAEDRATAAETELARLKATHAPAAQIAKAEAKVEATTVDDPEPNPQDEKYGGDGVKYVLDHARWSARDEYRQQQQREVTAKTQAQKHEQQQATLKSFGGRIDAAKSKYPDFEQVAFGNARIPEGSPVDAWIMEDDAGAEVLYHLQRNPAELDSLLGMPVLAQVKTLALLSQRLLPAQSEQAGNTGAVAGRQIKLAPKPPTPVRTTEPQRTSEAPVSDGSLSVMQHAKRHPRR